MVRNFGIRAMGITTKETQARTIPGMLARVRDVSLGGLFVETAKPRAVGSTAKVDFLVQEGQIRADAVVRHVEPGCGLGLKLTALSDGDRPHFIALLNRLRSSFR